MLIDKERAIRGIKRLFKMGKHYCDEQSIIGFLNTIQPEQRWVPVTERLPEPRIDVWCNSDLGQMVGYYDETIETWFGRDYLELLVNAWMPLPEPYKWKE